MMRKKANWTQVTPIPSYIPRQLALDLLHSHGEIITLNPLVLKYTAIKAPQSAPSDEYYSSWYEIEERLQFVPGIGKMGSSKLKFNGCFHDLPWGLQTHIYAPAGVDMRVKYKIAGNQPGEQREPVEMGIGAPADGLYLREDVEIKCNITMVSFVKKESKAASKTLVERMLKKAELLSEGTLQAMFENGKLTTINPADRTNYYPGAPTSPRADRQSSMYSPNPYQQQQQPGGHASYYDPNKPLPYAPGNQGYGGGVMYNNQGHGGFYPSGMNQSNQPSQPSQPNQSNQENQHPSFAQASGQNIAMELPGDIPANNAPQRSTDSKQAAPATHLHPAHRYSTVSELSSDTSRPARADANPKRYSEIDSSPRFSVTDYSDSSRPTSYATTVSDGVRSPRPDQSSFHTVPEEPENPHHNESLKRLEGQAPPQPPQYPYNPADYARV